VREGLGILPGSRRRVLGAGLRLGKHLYPSQVSLQSQTGLGVYVA